MPAELPGIFNWAISCLQEPYAPGQFLAQPDIPGGLLEEMWESMSPIGDFLAEDMEKEAGAWVFTEDVANAFADRYPAYRNSKAYDARSIAVEIRIVDPTIERGQKRDPRHGDKPRPILKGVRLRK